MRDQLAHQLTEKASNQPWRGQTFNLGPGHAGRARERASQVGQGVQQLSKGNLPNWSNPYCAGNAWHTHSLSRGIRPRDAKRWKGVVLRFKDWLFPPVGGAGFPCAADRPASA